MGIFGSFSRVAAVGTMIVGLGLAAGTAEAATPPGIAKQHPVFGNVVCDDGSTPTVFSGGGRSGWVDGTLYVITSATFQATFVPNDGSPPISETFTKTYGAGPKGDTLSCTSEGTFDDPDGSGTFSAQFDVVAVPGGK